MKRFVFLLMLIASPLWAVEPDEILDDPALEARARDLSKGLRCLVCQNESIDESNASLARDLRILLRERLVAGDSDEAAVDFIRQFKVDYAVIGTSAIDPDGALLDYDFREVKVAQAIIANARQVILVADSTKFERTAPVRIGHLEQVDTFVTDLCQDDRVRKICRDFDVELIETMRLP